MQLKHGVVTEVVTITFENGVYTMTNSEGHTVAEDNNTFEMSRYAFIKNAKRVVHNYGIFSCGTAYII
jgi:hypothetical protein